MAILEIRRSIGNVPLGGQYTVEELGLPVHQLTNCQDPSLGDQLATCHCDASATVPGPSIGLTGFPGATARAISRADSRAWLNTRPAE
jgi:hypothetical protein